MNHPRTIGRPGLWPVFVLAGLLAGCGANQAEGDAEGEAPPAGAACASDADVACYQVCEVASGTALARQCDFAAGCSGAPDPLPACDATDLCVDGLCRAADQCTDDSECSPTEGDDAHVTVCTNVVDHKECVVGCRNDDYCRPADSVMPWRCILEVEGFPHGQCEGCACQTDVDCEGSGEAGKLYACGKDAPCQCAEVECRPGFADCEAGFVCNPRAYVCESETCRSHDDCADMHKHCKRSAGSDVGRCVCGDDVGTGACEDDDCRATGQCQTWEGFGPTFICENWNCQETPCERDDECDVLGTACGPDGVCVPQTCAGDEECPRRRDIVPMPSGVFWCDGAPAGTCAVGCRDDLDCEDTHKCQAHECTPRVCTGPADCGPGRWCDPDSPNRPADAPENSGICEEGCDENPDCPQGQPCRLDRHLCGCVVDADCAIIDPDLVCNDDGTCGPPCRGHDDCAGDEACIEGHCYEDACRNDVYEANDTRADAFEFVREGEVGQAGLLTPCEGDEDNLCGEFRPRLCSEPPPRASLVPDIADWFSFPLNRFEELEIVVTWPMVDTDGDGWGDAPGACDQDVADLSASTSLFRPGEDDPNVPAREWPRPNWRFEAPGPNQPCTLTVDTSLPAPRAQTYWLVLENLLSTEFDYGLDVKLRQTLDCARDRHEDNDVHGDARNIFSCEPFLLQGGHLQAHEDIENQTLCMEDSDWYTLTLRQDDRVNVVATYDNRLGELRATLRPPAEHVAPEANLLYADVVGEDGRLEFQIGDAAETAADGDYLLQITAGRAANLGIPVQTAYDLHVSCEGPRVPCVPDATESNDTAVTAACINLTGGACPVIPANDGQPYVWRRPAQPNDPDAVPQHLCATGDAPDGRDEDWHTFSVGEGGQVNVLLENELGPGGVWYMEVELLDEDLEVVRASRNAGSINSINEVGLAAGTYFVRVLHPVNVLEERTVPYGITITVFGAAPECAEDGYEENDSFETARQLPLAPIDEGGDFTCFPVDDSHLALCAAPPDQAHDEEDWFMVDLTGVVAERIDVEVRCQPGGDDLYVELRGEDGRLSCPQNVPPDRACRDISPDCGEGAIPRRMTLLQPRGEEQRIKIYGINDAQNQYDLCARVVADACDDDEYENNDVCAQATGHDPVASPFLNQFFSLESFTCPGDDDYYVFRPSQAPQAQPENVGLDEYDIRVLVSTSADADLDVQLMDKFCDRRDVLEEDVDFVTDICLVHEGARADDDFFVRVYGADALSESEYEIKVDIGPPGTLFCD